MSSNRRNAARNSNQDLQDAMSAGWHSISGDTVIAVEAQSNFCWSDDSWDPMDHEVVAIYRNEREFRIAESQNTIPIGTTYRAQGRQFDLIEIPKIGHQHSQILHVVFKTCYKGIESYHDYAGRIHDSYRVDSTGYPLAAFTELSSAIAYRDELNDELRIKKPRMQEPFSFTVPSTWDIVEHQDLNLWELTTLKPDEFERQLISIGLRLDSWTSIWLGAQEKPDEAALRDDQARKIWKLLDRVVFYKVVAMYVELHDSWY